MALKEDRDAGPSEIVVARSGGATPRRLRYPFFRTRWRPHLKLAGPADGPTQYAYGGKRRRTATAYSSCASRNREQSEERRVCHEYSSAVDGLTHRRVVQPGCRWVR